MAKFKQIIKTNVPFTTTKCQMLFYLPEGTYFKFVSSEDINISIFK